MGNPIVTLCKCGKPVGPRLGKRPPRWCSIRCYRRHYGRKLINGRSRQCWYTARWRERHPEESRASVRRSVAKYLATQPEKSRACYRRYWKKKRQFKYLMRFLWELENMKTKIEAPAGNQDFAAIREQVRKMKTAELRSAFATGLRLVREQLLRLAAIVAELDERSEKLEGNPHMLRMFRRIAAGTLIVDVVLRFADRPYLMDRLAKMPADKQAALLEKSDEEIAETLARRKRDDRQGAGDDDPVFRHQERSARDDDFPTLSEMASSASVGDAAEMCLEIVRKNGNPQAVAEKLLPELQRLKNQRKRPAFAM